MIVTISKGIRELGEDMVSNPINWEQQAYTFTNKHHKDVSIWTANGILFLGIRDGATFTIAEKLYIRACMILSAARKVKLGKDGNLLTQAPNTSGVRDETK
jgi:hypothetical protein